MVCHNVPTEGVRFLEDDSEITDRRVLLCWVELVLKRCPVSRRRVSRLDQEEKEELRRLTKKGQPQPMAFI